MHRSSFATVIAVAAVGLLSVTGLAACGLLTHGDSHTLSSTGDQEAADDQSEQDDETGDDGDGSENDVNGDDDNGDDVNGDDDNGDDDNGDDNQNGDDSDPRPVSEMVDADISAMCDDLHAIFDDMETATLESGVCQFGGYALSEQMGGSDPVGECEDTKNDCLDDDPTDEFHDDCPFEVVPDSDLDDCDATDEEIVACWHEIRDGLETFADTVACQDLEGELNDDQQQAYEDIQLDGSTCSVASQDCPLLEQAFGAL